MSISKPLAQSTKADIVSLLDNKVPEGRHLDYKVALFAPSDKTANDGFRKDVTAFANSDGGNLVVGMSEKGGIPIDLVGQEISDRERFMQRANQVLRTRVFPPVPGWQMHFIDLEEGKPPLSFASLKVSSSLIRSPRKEIYTNFGGEEPPITTDCRWMNLGHCSLYPPPLRPVSVSSAQSVY